jgi:hypothetical protein
MKINISPNMPVVSINSVILLLGSSFLCICIFLLFQVIIDS